MSKRFEPTSPNKWSTDPAPCDSEAETYDIIKNAAEDYIEHKRIQFQNPKKLQRHIEEQSEVPNSHIFQFLKSKVRRGNPDARRIIDIYDEQLDFWREMANVANLKYTDLIIEQQQRERIHVRETQRLRNEIQGLRNLLHNRGVSVDIPDSSEEEDEYAF